MAKAIIFDLDGTLLDTVTDLADAANFVLTQHSFPIKNYQEYKNLVGKGIKELISNVIPSFAKNEELITKCFSEMKQEYSSLWKLHTKMYPGIAELLTYLSQRKIPMAILSNKEEAFVREITAYALNSWKFDQIVGTSTNLLPKPDPKGALVIAKNLSLSPQEFLFVGDSDLDMETAKNAGMTRVFAAWGYQKQNPRFAALIAKQPTDILAYLS